MSLLDGGKINMPVNIKFFNTGYCTHPEKIAIKGGSSEPCKFYALFALIEHSKYGLILYDTGYSSRFYAETKVFPFNIYAKITPVYFEDEDSAISQLRNIGINPEDINLVILSHFHADHIGAISDFLKSNYLCFKSAYEDIKNKKGLSALKKGFIPNFIPRDFLSRVKYVDDYEKIELPSELSPFKYGYDICGDRSVISVELEGHAKGQQGVFIQSDKGSYFLISDACWLSKSYRELILPHPIANLAFSNKKAYKDNLERIHSLHKNNPKVNIIPSHCPEVRQKFVQEGENNA